jgi:coronin-1B/1C/6
MSKFVRSSKYRHVFAENAKLDSSYANLKLSKNPWDSNYCAVNSQFLAVCWQTGGGGAAAVLPLSKTGKLGEVALVEGHSGPVLDVAFSPFNDYILATASEDSTVKIWAIPESGPKTTSTAAQELRGHGRKAGSVTFNPVANNVLATSAIDFKVKVWDIEQGTEKCSVDGHAAIIQSVEWNYNGSLLATFCKDKKLRVIDPRSGTVTAEVEAHQGVKGGRATFLGSKGLIFSAGFNKQSERRLAIWDPAKMSEPLVEQAIDNAAGIIMPFWDDSSSVLFTAGKGDGNVRFYEIVSDDKVIYPLSQHGTNVPQQGMCALPKSSVDVSNNEIMRLYKATATQVEPLSFRVPRKSDVFQDDLFPDAPGAVPALTAEEWASGKTADPVLQSMAPGFVKAAAPKADFKPVVQEKKVLSEAELRSENEKLAQRISFLEAELVKRDARIKELEGK